MPEDKRTIEQLRNTRDKLKDALKVLAKVEIPERAPGEAQLKALRETLRKEIDQLEDRIKHRQETDVPPVVDGGWHPGAERKPYPSSGGFTPAAKKIVLHTTEGSSLPTYSGSAPHFTLDPKTGKLYQHVPISQASSSLVNAPGGVETNHAGAIQIEMIGFAKDTPSWTDTQYANVRKLVSWICTHAGISQSASVTFSTTPHRMSGAQWLAYNGICGHQHVPENEHWDPGAFKVEKVT